MIKQHYVFRYYIMLLFVPCAHAFHFLYVGRITCLNAKTQLKMALATFIHCGLS